MIKKMDKTSPSGDPDKDLNSIVELSKHIIKDYGMLNPILFAISSKKGNFAGSGGVPRNWQDAEKLFNDLGKSIAENINDVEMFVIVSEASIKIKSFKKDKDIREISKEELEAISEEDRELNNVLLVSAKKINGYSKTVVLPFSFDNGILSWDDCDKAICEMNKIGWSSHMIERGIKTKFKKESKNAILECVYNGYRFKQLCDNIK